MEKMYVTVENPTNATESVYDGFEPRRPRSAMASYRCKVFCAYLEQGAASQHLTPIYSSQPKNGRE